MRTLGSVLLTICVSALTYVAMHVWVARHLPVALVEAPALSGMTVVQARAVVDARGLRLVLDEERASDAVEPGKIAEQRPLAGSTLRRGDELHAVVARRSARVRVPQTAGMTPAAARQLLEGAGLRLGQTTQAPDAQVAAGLILGSTPAAEQEAARDSAVDLRVSAGAMTTPVPQLFGKRQSTAKELLVKAGFVVGNVRQGSNDDRDSGEVIGQTPRANEPAPVGSKVDLVVNE